MTTEQTPSAEEGCDMRLKALEKVSNSTFLLFVLSNFWKLIFKNSRSTSSFYAAFLTDIWIPIRLLPAKYEGKMKEKRKGLWLTSWMIFCSSLFSLSSCLDFSSSLLLVDEPVFMVSWASDCHSPRVIRRRIYKSCRCFSYYTCEDFSWMFTSYWRSSSGVSFWTVPFRAWLMIFL